MPLARGGWKAPLHRAPAVRHEIQLQQIVKFQEPRAQAIVDVVVVIGDVIRQRRHLRFKAGPVAQLQRKRGVQFGQRPVRLHDRAVVLGQPLQQFPRQVQPVELAIGAFQPHQRAQAVGVVIEPAVSLHRRVQRFLAGMAERRVADVVRQAQRLGQVLVQPQRAGDHPADLRHFQAVGQPDAVVIAIRRDKHLGLVAQPAERDRMDDPVTVALIRAARAARNRFVSRKFSPPAARGIRGIGSAENHQSPKIQSTAASAWMRVQS